MYLDHHILTCTESSEILLFQSDVAMAEQPTDNASWDKQSQKLHTKPLTKVKCKLSETSKTNL